MKSRETWQIVAARAVIEFYFLKLFFGKPYPSPFFIKIVGLAPMAFPIEVIAQSYAMLGQKRTEGFGNFFQKDALILFRWLHLWPVRQISNVVFMVEILEEHDEIGLCARIASHMRIKDRCCER